MLARRFTIVCLLMTLFGMAFAMVVNQGTRSERTWTTLCARHDAGCR
jgi:uncharacterized membrane protein YeiB